MTIDTINQLKLQLGSPPWAPPVHGFNENILPFRAGQAYHPVLSGLFQGKTYCFEDTYGTAMGFYSWMKKQLNKKYPVSDYQSSRKHKDRLQQLSQQLLLPVRAHRAALKGAPQNGWLRLLFPDQPDFLLSLPAFLGMNGSWQWFTKGIKYPGLERHIHPFFGTYFPTRTEHLELFRDWLSTQKPASGVLDMGTGCGVLTQYLLQFGYKNISATDININSLYSLACDLQGSGGHDQVRLVQASFFDKTSAENFDWVIFNPPWIPDESVSLIDKAIYHKPDFFTGFFEHAGISMAKGSRLMLFFSTFSQVAGISDTHPIQKELDHGRFKLEKLMKSAVKQPVAKRKNWLSAIRQKEEVELWVLKKI